MSAWEILGKYEQANGQFKITARCGSLVAHIERVEAEQAEAFGPADAAAYWERCKR